MQHPANLKAGAVVSRQDSKRRKVANLVDLEKIVKNEPTPAIGGVDNDHFVIKPRW